MLSTSPVPPSVLQTSALRIVIHALKIKCNLLRDRVGCKAAGSLFAICHRFLACCFHSVDTIFCGLVLSTYKLGKRDFSSIVRSKGLLEIYITRLGLPSSNSPVCTTFVPYLHIGRGSDPEESVSRCKGNHNANLGLIKHTDTFSWNRHGRNNTQQY